MTKLQFCGDVWLPTGTSARLPDWFIEGLVFNLEGPVTTHDVAVPGKICLKSDPAVLREAFANARPAAACLANNHVLDYGAIGFEDTCAHLDELGIPFFGAGTTANRCNNPRLLKVDETIVGLMGYVCPSTHPIFASEDRFGVAPIQIDEIRTDVEAARKSGATRLVVCLHWGHEDVELPKSTDIEVARQILGLGVDLVIGHHAHCRQPIYHTEMQSVFFGLGNALFPDLDYHGEDGTVAWNKQRWWNQRSSLAIFSPRSGIVRWSTIEQRASTLVVRAPSGEPQGHWDALPTITENLEYQRRFSWAMRWATARMALSRFIERPKLPSLKTIEYLSRSIIRGS
jgi:hypothetical protein